MINQQFLRTFDLGFLDDLIGMMGLHESYPVQPGPLYNMLNVNIYRDLRLPVGCNAFSALHSRNNSGLAVFDRELKGKPLRNY